MKGKEIETTIQTTVITVRWGKSKKRQVNFKNQNCIHIYGKIDKRLRRLQVDLLIDGS